MKNNTIFRYYAVVPYANHEIEAAQKVLRLLGCTIPLEVHDETILKQNKLNKRGVSRTSKVTVYPHNVIFDLPRMLTLEEIQEIKKTSLVIGGKAKRVISVFLSEGSVGGVKMSPYSREGLEIASPKRIRK